MTPGVEVVWGIAEGNTPLSSFDSALADAGIQNYNLVTLSSVVPEGMTVDRRGRHEGSFGVGAPVATVLSENTASVSQKTVAAGLGWHLAEEGGIFYEATADSTTDCRNLLQTGLDDARSIRDWSWRGDPQFEIHEHVVDRTGSVVVAAVYGPLEEAFHR